MAELADVRGAPPLWGGARGLLGWICTSNPFYVLSAGLFLAGLWISFEARGTEVDTWALMLGLGGYTLLLAATAFLLVRFANVWDDVRTVLLLVVLMFLATSVTFDELLAVQPARGVIFYVGGLMFAAAVSEGLLRGIRLRLPGWFRAAYYLILALFFLYPVALTPFLAQPHSETLMWGLFGFSTAAGVAFLSLLPAIRRGVDYARDHGSPWPWPLYPWSLFTFLALAVPGRALLLCWSMHWLDGDDRRRVIFGPYFVVPFGLAIAILLIEAGVVSRSRAVLAAALAAPLLLIVLALVGHRHDPIYTGFLDIFHSRLGGYPLFLTLLASAAFYGYALLRRVPRATEGLTLALVALAFAGPDTLQLRDATLAQPVPLLLAGFLQLGLGLWRRSSWRSLAGTMGVVAGCAVAVPADDFSQEYRWLVFHLALALILLFGAVFDDWLSHLLRLLGPVIVLSATVAALVGNLPAGVPSWAAWVYPPAMASVLAAYGWWLRHRPVQIIAALAAINWLAMASWHGYLVARAHVVGLDYLALSLALFAVAIVISLGKAGRLWPSLLSRQRPLATGDN